MANLKAALEQIRAQAEVENILVTQHQPKGGDKYEM